MLAVHWGSAPNRGLLCPFYCGEKSWLLALFDDDVVEKMGAQATEEFYGLTLEKKSESLIFYSIHQDNNLKDCGTHLNGGKCSKHSELQTFSSADTHPPQEAHQQCTLCLKPTDSLPLSSSSLHFPTCSSTVVLS